MVKAASAQRAGSVPAPVPWARHRYASARGRPRAPRLRPVVRPGSGLADRRAKLRTGSRPAEAGERLSVGSKYCAAIPRATITPAQIAITPQAATKDAIIGTISKGKRPAVVRRLFGFAGQRGGSAPGGGGRRLRAAHPRGERACLEAASAQHEVADGVQLVHDSLYLIPFTRLRKSLRVAARKTWPASRRVSEIASPYFRHFVEAAN